MSLKEADIFLKPSKKSKLVDDITVDSALFTTSTPSKMDNISDSAFMTKNLMALHKKILDSDLLPDNYSDYRNTSESLSATTNYSHHGGAKTSTGLSTGLSTMDLPINYSESTLTDTSALRSAMEYAYKDMPDVEYCSATSSDSSTSVTDSTDSVTSVTSVTSVKPPKKRKVSRTKPKKPVKKSAPKKTIVKRANSKKRAPKKISDK